MSSIRSQLEQFVVDLKEDDKKKIKTTPRNLIWAFNWEKRTPNCCAEVDSYLVDKNLEVFPDYRDVWIDAEIILSHKLKATTKLVDPVKKVMLLDAANSVPQSIGLESTLQEAVSKMLYYRYSQLPVILNERDVRGFVSWETIGKALSQGKTSNELKDYTEKNITILSYDTPLLSAVKQVYDSGFVLIRGQDKTICGIVTTTDISLQFLKMTEPFLLIEQIENYIRQIFHGRLLLEDLQSFCGDNGSRVINSIDDLVFGEYIRLIQNPNMWDKLELTSVQKNFFEEKLDLIRKARNDIMHFHPDGISNEQLDDLNSMSQFLAAILEN